MTDWNGCYDEGWKGIIVDEAFAHPAKMSYSLVHRIYEHAFKASWLKPGDTVIDPFGGIAGTALHAAIHGLKWIGCELEPKFHDLGNQNIDLWQKRWGHFPEWVRPTLHCGDSRRLAEVIGLAELCVSSPPYSSCEAIAPRANAFYEKWAELGGRKENYKCHADNSAGYGSSPGQLSTMVVGSPPFEGVIPTTDVAFIADAEQRFNNASRRTAPQDYGDTAGNIGNQSGETFWTAARDIVQQCHDILRLGGHAIWVCKDFVRKGKRVPFSDQWLALCESIGFHKVCRHRAMLVKTGGTQKLLDGGEHVTTRERKSFFRRLAEKKGSPRIDWEDVICVRKQGE